MAECQEVMLRHLTVSIWEINQSVFFKHNHGGSFKAQRINGNQQETYKEDTSISVSLSAGVLELKSVKPGHIAIKGQSSSLFLCMDSEGRLRGQVQ